MLPSRITETPASVNRKVAVFEARIWRGKVTRSKRVDDGTIRIRKANGNDSASRYSQPARKITIPEIKSRSEMRGTKNQGTSAPIARASRANSKITRPDQEGFNGSAANFARSSQSRSSAKAGTKKPWM